MSTYERLGRGPSGPPISSGEGAVRSGLAEGEGDAPPVVASARPGGSEIRTILVSLMLTMFLAALDQTIVATALPTIGRQFHEVTTLTWIITAYLLASTAVAPLFGTLSDIYGRRAMIVIALGLFIAGSVFCALAQNMATLIAARGVQGIGGGGILPLVQTIISDVVTPRERGRYQAYLSGVWTAAGIAGPVLGGVFAEHLHWSMIFWINVPLGFVSLALLLPKMGSIPVFHRRRRVDWTGGMLLMTSAVVFMLVLTWGGNRFAWLSREIAAMLGVSLVLAMVFVRHARKASEPFLPLSLIGGSVVPYAIAASALALSAIIGITVHLPLYYQVVHHLGASESGLALIPIAAVSTGGAMLAGRAMTHTLRYKRIAIAGTAFAAVMAAIMAAVTMPLWPLLAMLSLFAFGLGTIFPVSVVSLQNAVMREQVGTVTGAMNFFRALACSFVVAAFAAVLLMTLGTDAMIGHEGGGPISAIAASDLTRAFRYVFAATAAMMAAAALLLARMEERPLAGPSA